MQVCTFGLRQSGISVLPLTEIKFSANLRVSSVESKTFDLVEVFCASLRVVVPPPGSGQNS